MEIKMKVLALAAIAVIGLAMPLSAQLTAKTEPASNQSAATAGVFGTDVDNYMNVNYYGDVNFNKWFGYVGGDASGIFNLGYATKFGAIYLGTYYSGNLFKTETNETTRLTTTWDTNLQQMLTRRDDKIYTRTTTNTNNNIAALIGLTGLQMGIQVGFYENITTYNTPYNVTRGGTSTKIQNADGSITYTNNDSLNYEESDGDLIPYIQWGMQLKVGSYNLTPRVGVAVNFYQDKLIDKYYASGRTVYQGKIVGQEQITREGNNDGCTILGIAAGADFYLNDSMYVGLDYGLTMDIYDQSFGDAGRSGSVNGTIKWNTTNTTDNYIDRTVKSDVVNINVIEQSSMIHTIVPAFWKQNALGENLKLGVLVKLPITIASGFASSYTDEWTTNETTYIDANNFQNNTTTIKKDHTAGDKTETSIFNIAPTVGVGVSYDLIPNKFTVNAGINVNVPSFTSTSIAKSPNGVDSTYTKTEVGFGSGKHTTGETLTVTAPATIRDSVQTTTKWSGLSGSIAGGFVFSFNDNFALDLLAETDVPTDAFSVNLTKLSVLFSVKF